MNNQSASAVDFSQTEIATDDTYLLSGIVKQVMHIVDNLFIIHVRVWMYLTKREYFPDRDSECPHVACSTKFALYSEQTSLVYMGMTACII